MNTADLYMPFYISAYTRTISMLKRGARLVKGIKTSYGMYISGS